MTMIDEFYRYPKANDFWSLSPKALTSGVAYGGELDRTDACCANNSSLILCIRLPDNPYVPSNRFSNAIQISRKSSTLCPLALSKAAKIQ